MLSLVVVFSLVRYGTVWWDVVRCGRYFWSWETTRHFDIWSTDTALCRDPSAAAVVDMSCAGARLLLVFLHGSIQWGTTRLRAGIG